MKIYSIPVAVDSSIVAYAKGNTPEEALEAATDGNYILGAYGDINEVQWEYVEPEWVEEDSPPYPADEETLLRHAKEMHRILLALGEWEQFMGGFENPLFEDARKVVRDIQDQYDKNLEV